mgnify:CR=1 FL=1
MLLLFPLISAGFSVVIAFQLLFYSGSHRTIVAGLSNFSLLSGNAP